MTKQPKKFLVEAIGGGQTGYLTEGNYTFVTNRF